MQVHTLRQATHVMVGLNGCARALKGNGLDHVGIQGTLCQKVDTFQLLRLFLKNLDEQITDGFALLFGIGNIRKHFQKTLTSVDHLQGNLEIIAEYSSHLLRFAKAQQTVIHKNTGDLLADSAMNEHRSHSRIHSAGKRGNNPTLTHLGADRRHCRIHVGVHGPLTGASANATHKGGEHLRTARRMGHLQMELHAVEVTDWITDRRQRRIGTAGQHPETIGHGFNPVTMTHPNLFGVTGSTKG